MKKEKDRSLREHPSKSEPVKRDGLCFRCEHRAAFLEGGSQPRFECGQPSFCSHSCYMFKPVKPVVLTQSDPSDRRPFLGPALIASRASVLRHITDKDLVLRAKKKKGGYLVYWGSPLKGDI